MPQLSIFVRYLKNTPGLLRPILGKNIHKTKKGDVKKLRNAKKELFKKPVDFLNSPFFVFLNYSCSGAPTGHTEAQAPHSRHALASITYELSPSEMQLTGHSEAQAPQLMQASLIL